MALATELQFCRQAQQQAGERRSENGAAVRVFEMGSERGSYVVQTGGHNQIGDRRVAGLLQIQSKGIDSMRRAKHGKWNASERRGKAGVPRAFSFRCPRRTADSSPERPSCIHGHQNRER